MGLDMFLSKKIFIGGNYEHRKVTGEINLSADGEPIKVDLKKLVYMEEEAGYWRKANAIHNWFVQNCQDGEDDCRNAYVTISDLKELLSLCNEVLNVVRTKQGQVVNGYSFDAEGNKINSYEDGIEIINKEKIAELLPSASGFFFGSTDYDQYYLDDIKHTKQIIEDILSDPDCEKYEYYYHSSW